jgi:hypothetical protein
MHYLADCFFIFHLLLLYVLNAVSGTNSYYPVNNKTLITIHRNGRNNEHKLFPRVFKVNILLLNFLFVYCN